MNFTEEELKTVKEFGFELNKAGFYSIIDVEKRLSGFLIKTLRNYTLQKCVYTYDFSCSMTLEESEPNENLEKFLKKHLWD